MKKKISILIIILFLTAFVCVAGCTTSKYQEVQNITTTNDETCTVYNFENGVYYIDCFGNYATRIGYEISQIRKTHNGADIEAIPNAGSYGYTEGYFIIIKGNETHDNK